MSKKTKLLTTIASLCLAVALLAFGVYAATSATFKVTSKVSFTATKDVYLTFVSGTAYKTAKLNNTNYDDTDDTTGWKETGNTYEASNANNWTTVKEDGSPIAKETNGTMTVLDYAFTNEVWQNGEGDGTTTPAVYGYKVELKFDIKHQKDSVYDDYKVTMTYDLDTTSTYKNVKIDFKVEKTEGQLVVTYLVLLTDTDASVLAEGVAVNCNITFKFERADDTTSKVDGGYVAAV